ncbi:MAG: alpha/beta hydrolase [Planctomycetota bacterium]
MAAEDQRHTPQPDEAVEAAGRRRRQTRWRRFKWTVRLTVLAILIGYPLLVGFDGWFYYPNNTIYQLPQTYGLEHEAVRFSTSDSLTLNGWFLPAARPARGTIIHFHGNAANISGHLLLVEWLPHRGYNVLMFDYRGYGESEGKVTRAGTILDGHAAVDYALSRADVRGQPLFVYGQSLGGAVAAVVAAERPEIDAVVLESPFSGYRRIAARVVRQLVFSQWVANGLAALTVSAGYDPVNVIAEIAPRPLLVIVAGADEVCFPELGRELYEAAAEPKEFWSAPGAGHLNIREDHDQELMERITDFLERSPTRATVGTLESRPANERQP